MIVASLDKAKVSGLDSDFSVLWTFPTGDEDPKIDLEAVYTTPVIVDATVYIAGYSGDVYALNLETGEPVWDFDAVDPIVAGLAAGESTVYVATEGGDLYALDVADGSVKERFAAGDGVWGAPLLAEGALYVSSVSGVLYALDAETLDPVWDRPYRTNHGLITDPVLADGTVLVGGIDRTLHAVNAEDGGGVWSYKADNWFYGRPLVEDGTVYAPNLDSELYALDLQSGDVLWTFSAEDTLRSAPVRVGDTLIIVDGGGTVYGLDTEAEGDERLKWSKELGKKVLSNPLVLEGQVLISAQGGELFRLDDVEEGTVSRLRDDGSFVEVVEP